MCFVLIDKSYQTRMDNTKYFLGQPSVSNADWLSPNILIPERNTEHYTVENLGRTQQKSLFMFIERRALE